MAGKATVDVSKYRLDSYRTPPRPSTSFHTWQQFRSTYRSSDHPLSTRISPPRSPLHTSPPRLPLRASPPRPSRFSSLRGQSPLQKYRTNPDLFYQNLNGKRTTSPLAGSFCSMLSTGLLRTRGELSMTGTTAVLKRRLNDVLRIEDLVKAQEVVAEMNSEDVRKLPPHYLEELLKTLVLLDRKIRHP